MTIEQWLSREMGKMLQELMFIEISYDTHQATWGVPCGPTLSMVNVVDPKGIFEFVDYQQDLLPWFDWWLRHGY